MDVFQKTEHNSTFHNIIYYAGKSIKSALLCLSQCHLSTIL